MPLPFAGRRRRAPLLAALTSLLLVPPAASAAGTVDVIVRRDPGLSAAERADIRADAGVRFDRALRLSRTEVVTVATDRADEALRALNADPDVRWAERDGVVSVAAVTTDPYFADLWGLQDPGDADMDVPEAWAQSTGEGVTVAVVDTGIAADHPDLAGQLATNPGESGSGRETNDVDDDGNGLVDDWRGWDFISHDNDPQDGHGHGTHVAGTIAAVNGNAVGITGAAPDADVLVVRALDDDGKGSWSGLADAFDYAGDMGARIVNASLGGVAPVSVLSGVIAAHPDTLYVVAAGNDSVNLATAEYAPCEVPLPNVLCVGATDDTDTMAMFSNYGSAAVDLFAPGVSILSTYPTGYAWMNGTSMATPHVAAEAALVLADGPGIPAADVRTLLMETSEPKPQLDGLSVTGARANALAALTAIQVDTDGDGVLDAGDNCPDVANPGQSDRDADGRGDACDATPDGPPPVVKPPVVTPPLTNPAIVPPVTLPPSTDEPGSGARPKVRRLTVALSRCASARRCARKARASVATRGADSVQVWIERRGCDVVGVCGWITVTGVKRRVSGTVRVTLPRKLRHGSYRVVAVAMADGRAGKQVTRRFRVG
jgi:thermitase